MSEASALAKGAGTLYIIDANNILFRAFHALPMLNASDGTPVNAVHGFVRMIHAVRRDYQPEYFVAVFDGGGPSFRNELYPEYKANRGEPPDELVPQFALARQALDAMSIPRVEYENKEADDVIATYARQAQERSLSVVIMSSDKDLMQIVHDGGHPSVYLLDTMKGIAIGPSDVKSRFGVGPERLGDLLALAGDSSDNIPGVPGIGPKTAATLLQEFGDLESVLAHGPQIKQKKRRERLIEHAEDARVSRRLIALSGDCEVTPLDELLDPGMDIERAQAFFGPMGFKAVLRELDKQPPTVAAAPSQTDPRGTDQAIELERMADFACHPTTYRTLLAEDLPGLREYLRSLAACELVAIQIATTSVDAMRSEIIGIALAGISEQGEPPPAAYLPLGHTSIDTRSSPQLTLDQAREWLGPLLANADIPKVIADHKHQALVLERHGLPVSGVEIDPVLASYVLDPARSSHELAALAQDVLGYGATAPEHVLGKGRKQTSLDRIEYAQATGFVAEQAECWAALGYHLGRQIGRAGQAVRTLYHQVEMPLADVLKQLERRGILLDRDELARQSAEITEQIEGIRQRVGNEVGHEVNLDSPVQLQKVLFEDRGLPPVRKTKTGYSTDARVLEELSLLDPLVKEIVEYRVLTKLRGTYLDALPALINPDTGRLHTVFHQTVAQTGRLSSSAPNLQNIPIRTEHGRRIREAFVAPPGRRIVALDYSQIELRVLAHLSGDPNLRSAFLEGVDVHRRTAAEVFEVPEDEVTAEQRRIAKAVNFGVIYGQTAFGLAQQLGIPRGKAGVYIKAYFEKIPGVENYMSDLVAQAKRRGFSETILGRRRRIPELKAKGPRRAHGERMARNTPIQGSAADIMKLSMVEVERALFGHDWGRMLLTVHDELIFECDEDRVDDLVTIAKPLMEAAFELEVPLQVDVGEGRTWAECKG